GQATGYRQTSPWQEIPIVVQVLFAQQGWLRPPQVAHFKLFLSQPRMAVLQALFAQQGCPASPQVAQSLVPTSQPNVALQALSAQQDWPSPPQGQAPFVHAPPPGQDAT